MSPYKGSSINASYKDVSIQGGDGGNTNTNQKSKCTPPATPPKVRYGGLLEVFDYWTISNFWQRNEVGGHDQQSRPFVKFKASRSVSPCNASTQWTHWSVLIQPNYPTPPAFYCNGDRDCAPSQVCVRVQGQLGSCLDSRGRWLTFLDSTKSKRNGWPTASKEWPHSKCRERPNLIELKTESIYSLAVLIITANFWFNVDPWMKCIA